MASIPRLQFVRFANIEEDTPSYHRRYDFFISKFSSMCHGNHENVELRDNIRVAGIRGLQGVIRKTVSDDLVENIWDKTHMEKIVPSLLFNMQNMVSYWFSSTSQSMELNFSQFYLFGLVFNPCNSNFHQRWFNDFIATSFSGICTSWTSQSCLIHAH